MSVTESTHHAENFDTKLGNFRDQTAKKFILIGRIRSDSYWQNKKITNDEIKSYKYEKFCLIYTTSRSVNTKQKNEQKEKNDSIKISK